MHGNLFEGGVALVTGANKGIRYEIARGLGAKRITVLIGARDPEKGEAAAARLQSEGADARMVQLDVTDPESVQNAANWIRNQIHRLDILVNNAGILEGMPQDGKPPDMEAIHRVYETNVFGAMRVTLAMLPLLRQSRHGRIVNMSSSLGSLTLASDPNSPISRFSVLGYNTSKTALDSLTVQFANQLRGTAIKVNAACPGYCATDINNHSGPRTAEQGAVTPIRLATLPDDGPTGGYFDDNGRVPW